MAALRLPEFVGKGLAACAGLSVNLYAKKLFQEIFVDCCHFQKCIKVNFFWARVEYLNQDDKRNQKLKVIIDQIFNCVLSPRFVTQLTTLVGCLKTWMELNLEFSVIILVNNLPVKWGSLLQQILDAFDINYIFDPWYTLPIRGGRLWSSKNGLCRRRAGTGDWVGWSEKLKNANLQRMQNTRPLRK